MAIHLTADERAVLQETVREAKAKGFHFVHSGRHTIAWKFLGRNVIVFSVAIRHPNDRHNNLLGKFYALEEFIVHKRYTKLRINWRNTSVKEKLTQVIDIIEENFHGRFA